MMRLRGRLSITTLGIMVSLVPMLLVGTVLTAISIRSSERLSADLGQAILRQTIVRVRESVQQYLGHATRLSDGLALAIDNGAIHSDDINAWKARILACLRGSPEVAAVGYADVPSGQYIYIVRYGQLMEMGVVGGKRSGAGQVETSLVSEAGDVDPASRRVNAYALDERPWYREAIASPGARWTSVYDWFIGETARKTVGQARGIAFARPIRAPMLVADTNAAPSLRDSKPLMGLINDHGARGFPVPTDRTIQGVLSVDLDLDQVSRYLAEIARPLNASLIVCDAAGNVVAATDPRLPRTWPADGGNGTDPGAEVDRALADYLRVHGRNSLATDASDGEAIASTQLEIGPRIFRATQVALPVASDTTWTLLLAIPEQPVLLRAKADIRRSIWIGLAYVAASGLMSAFVARGLARPFKRLAAFAHEVGAGHFDRRTDVAITREVAELSDALNGMASALEERIALLAAKDAAEEATAVKARIIAHVSHEFRTPLNAIMGYGELLRDAARTEGRTRDATDAGNILFAIGHLLELVENLLDLSRAEAGRLRLDVVEFSVGAFLNEVAASIRPVVERNGNEFSVHINDADAGARITTDPARLRQVLINLLSNAAQFTENGSVRLEAQLLSGGKRAAFSVADTGVGIEADQLPHIFEPFIQVHRDRGGRQREGAGLGLAIARQLCELLGGQLTVASEPGRGTTLTATLQVDPPIVKSDIH